MTLCNACGTESRSCVDGDYMHDFESLDKERCEKHEHRMVLHCVPCQTNVCAICYSEKHQNHACEPVSKVAERLTKTLKFDVEQLNSCKLRLSEVLAIVKGRLQKYERLLADLKVCCNGHINTQRLRAAEEAFQLEMRRRNVENFMKAKLKVTGRMIRSHNSGKVIDNGQMRGLLNDIKLLLDAVIHELSDQAKRLTKFLGDTELLKTKVNGILDSSSRSEYELTKKAVTVRQLGEAIKLLLRQSTVERYPNVTTNGRKELSAL